MPLPEVGAGVREGARHRNPDTGSSCWGRVPAPWGHGSPNALGRTQEWGTQGSGPPQPVVAEDDELAGARAVCLLSPPRRAAKPQTRQGQPTGRSRRARTPHARAHAAGRSRLSPLPGSLRARPLLYRACGVPEPQPWARDLPSPGARPDGTFSPTQSGGLAAPHAAASSGVPAPSQPRRPTTPPPHRPLRLPQAGARC